MEFSVGNKRRQSPRKERKNAKPGSDLIEILHLDGDDVFVVLGLQISVMDLQRFSRGKPEKDRGVENGAESLALKNPGDIRVGRDSLQVHLALEVGELHLFIQDLGDGGFGENILQGDSPGEPPGHIVLGVADGSLFAEAQPAHTVNIVLVGEPEKKAKGLGNLGILFFDKNSL